MASIILWNGWKKIVERDLPAVLAGAPKPAGDGAGCADPIAQLLERYAAGSECLAETLAAVPPSKLDQAPAPGMWSARQTTLHIVDAEIVGAARLRMLAAQPGCVLKSFAGDIWGEKLGYERLALEPALGLFAALRECTGEMLRLLPADAWSNRGVHEETGEITLQDLLLAHIQHTEAHMGEIAAIAAGIQAGAGSQ